MYPYAHTPTYHVCTCIHTQPHIEAVVVDKEKPPLNVVGDVHGRIAIIVVSTLHYYILVYAIT